MRSKYYKPSISKISTLLPKVFKKISKNYKANPKLLELKMNWDSIINNKISNEIFAEKIKKINNKNTLIIISKNSNLIEISYSSELIKNNINKYFKENLIDNVKFKKSLHC